MNQELIKCDDRKLVERILNDSTKELAFRELLGYMHKPIYFYLRTMLGNHDDAADAKQNTFIQVHTTLKNSYLHQTKALSFGSDIKNLNTMSDKEIRKDIENFRNLEILETEVRTAFILDCFEIIGAQRAGKLPIPEREFRKAVIDRRRGNNNRTPHGRPGGH
jgi:hypothetical protein